MKKKLLATLLSAAMAISALAGCGSANDVPAAEVETTDDTAVDAEADETAEAEETTGDTISEEPVTITLGIWPEDTLTSDIEMHEGYVEAFKTTHPDAEIVPAYYKYAPDTFMPLVESGNLPTVYENWFTDVQKTIRSGAAADITDELERRGWLDSINPSIRAIFSDENGRVYGIPRDAYALGIMVNVELFEQAGLVDEEGYPIYPKTWEELAETAKQIKDATGAAGLCLLAKENAGGWHFSNIAWGFGATLCIDNGDGTYTSNLASPEVIEAMEYVKSLKWEYDVLTPDPLSEDWGTGFTALGTGGAAMYIGANDAVNQPTQANGLPVDKLAMCAIPAGPAGQFSLMGGTPYMFSKDATPEEISYALDYLEIMGKTPSTSEEALAGIRTDNQNKADSGVPVIPRFPCWTDQAILDAENAIIEELSNVDVKMYQSYFDAASSSGLRVEEPGMTQDMYAELVKVMQAVLVDENADIPALLETANDNYQAILDANFQ